MNKSISAGGVVLNQKGQVLLVSSRGDSWSLPKGHLEPGEDARTAAAREIQEESGISQLEFIKELGQYQRYRIGLGGIGEDKTHYKTIIIFLYRTDQLDLAPEDPANPEARWVDANKVALLLTHPKDKAFYLKVLPQITAVASAG